MSHIAVGFSRAECISINEAQMEQMLTTCNVSLHRGDIVEKDLRLHVLIRPIARTFKRHNDMTSDNQPPGIGE